MDAQHAARLNNEVANTLADNLQTIIDHWRSGLIMDTELICKTQSVSLGAVLDISVPAPTPEGHLDVNTGLKFWPAAAPK